MALELEVALVSALTERFDLLKNENVENHFTPSNYEMLIFRAQ